MATLPPLVGGKPSAKLVVYGPARLAEKEMLDSLVAKQRDKVYEHTTVGRVFLALCHTDLDFDPSELSHPERCLADRKAVEWAASHSQISIHGKFLKDTSKKYVLGLSFFGLQVCEGSVSPCSIKCLPLRGCAQQKRRRG